MFFRYGGLCLGLGCCVCHGFFVGWFWGRERSPLTYLSGIIGMCGGLK
ncbi:MAG: hypothetical protein O4859_27450 [Trichodesmium sp. St18_bin1]|nr:hypothetical protein [Trichodesmium sp. St18_bin1]